MQIAQFSISGMESEARRRALGSAGLRLDTVNGVKVRNLRHLAELVDGCGDEFIRFGMDDDDPWNEEIIVDRAQMREATPRVMERYKNPSTEAKTSARRKNHKLAECDTISPMRNG